MWVKKYIIQGGGDSSSVLSFPSLPPPHHLVNMETFGFDIFGRAAHVSQNWPGV